MKGREDMQNRAGKSAFLQVAALESSLYTASQRHSEQNTPIVSLDMSV